MKSDLEAGSNSGPRRGVFIKNPANLITSLRIVFALTMALAPLFSVLFWFCYLCAGVSDVLDGRIARKLNLQSEAGARLDSAADAVFAGAIASIVILNFRIPVWLWLCAVGIALLRLVGYAIGYAKYHVFSALHTYANKAVGALIFAFPILYAVLGLTAAGVLICAAAFVSALEEVLITISATMLDRDCKGLWAWKTMTQEDTHEEF